MPKATSPSFVLTLKLNTNASDDDKLAHRFYTAFLMKNRLISYARKKLSAMRQDKAYRSLMTERISLSGKSDPASKHLINDINHRLADIRMSYGLSECQFHEWIALQQYRYKRYIDSLTAQKIATAVWRSVEDVMFRKGKSIHFCRLEQMHSVEGKNNASGIRFRGNTVYWLGLSIPVQLRKGDAYAREALRHKVKYCRIVRMPMGITYHYYVQLILEGVPPQKHKFLEYGDVGIDPGTSSEAIVSDTGCILTELGEGRQDIEKQVSKLQRRLDRSRRAVNPDNYDPDGTIKPRRGRKPWVRSRSYKNDWMRLKTLRRRNAGYIKQSEEMLANVVLCEHGSDIFAEKMDYRALQLKAKESKVSEKTGRYTSRKRFGKSLARHAPSRFLNILERKLGYMGKTINYVDTWKYRASQYIHDTDTYEKVSLNTRSKVIAGHRVQRDLYSAYLIKNARAPDVIDRQRCMDDFETFIKLHDKCINELLNSSNPALGSFGLKEFVA